MKIRLKQALKLCMMLIFAGLSATSFAQSITGVVTDSKDGSPAAGVTVSVKGTKTAVKTDAAGAYSITAGANATLVFSYVGFGTEQVKVSGNIANMKLVAINQKLEDVVVVAYGTRKKTDLTGSVVSIGVKDFQKGSINSTEQLLQGKVAGLEITTGGGAAGGGSKIRIRGGASLNASNDPLIVIDGIPVEGNGVNGSPNYLGTINPNDIESITVLKDAASTVLYGSRASNGVILVTTKKGTSGKTVFNFNSKYSIAQIQKYNNVLTGDQVRQVITEQAALPGGNNDYKSKLGGANTDWQKAIFQDASGYDNNLSASGTLKLSNGSVKVPFRASLGYLNQDGILKTNNSSRFSSSLNLSPKFFTDHLSVNLALKYSNQNTRFADEGAIGSAVSMDPTQPVYSGNKNWGGFYESLQPSDGNPYDLSTKNPLGLLLQKHTNGVVDRTIGNIQLDYKFHFFPDLHILANVGLDDSYGYKIDQSDSSASFSYKTKGFRNIYSESKSNHLADISLFYTKDLPSIKSKLDILALHSYQAFETQKFLAPNSIKGGSETDPQSIPKNAKELYQNRIESYVGRINYSYNDRYLISASIRRDATSKFDPDYRIGYFPGVSLAWKLKNDFFKNSTFVNELKLRASYGKTGNQDGIGGYTYQPTYSASNPTAQYQFGNSFYNFLRPDAYIVNTTWESTSSTNIGLDFAILGNRISGSVDVYDKLTSNLIAYLPIPLGANFTNNFNLNAGNNTNKGIEVNLTFIPVKSKNLTWSLNVNGSYNYTEVTKLFLNQVPGSTGLPFGNINGGTGNSILRYVVGSPAPIFYPNQQVYNSNGMPIEGLYADNNRDGSYSEDDRIIFKKPTADFLFGLNTQFSIYNFTLGLAAHGQVGNYNYNNFNSSRGSIASLQNASTTLVGNASTNYLETRFQKPQYLSSYYIENGSFLRLDNINIGYNFGKLFNSKSSLSLNASVQNVLVITNYSGLDPELTDGVDKNIYPRPRIISVGASINF